MKGSYASRITGTDDLDFPDTLTKLKLYFLDLDRGIARKAGEEHLRRSLTKYHGIVKGGVGVATIYASMNGMGTTIRIFQEYVDIPEDGMWLPFNIEDLELLESGKEKLSNTEMIIFGKEAELLEALGYDIPRWFRVHAVRP